MARFLALVPAVALALAGLTHASPISARSDAPCTAFGQPDEFYYKLSAHSSPLHGVEISKETGLLSAVQARDTNVQFQFERCDAPSTGYVQGQPIAEGQAAVYFGHVVDVASGKCLHHRADSLDFDLQSCPSTDVAEEQLPFWFETTNEHGSVRFTGYKNTTAYPDPVWFDKETSAVPYAIKTQQAAQNGDPNQWVLARPIRV